MLPFQKNERIAVNYCSIAFCRRIPLHPFDRYAKFFATIDQGFVLYVREHLQCVCGIFFIHTPYSLSNFRGVWHHINMRHTSYFVKKCRIRKFLSKMPKKCQQITISCFLLLAVLHLKHIDNGYRW